MDTPEAAIQPLTPPEVRNRVCAWLASNPGALRREVLAAIATIQGPRPKRRKHGRAVKVFNDLLANGRIVRTDSPSHQGVYIVRAHRARIRWVPTVD